VARPPPDRQATHPISPAGNIYIYIFPRRQRTPSRRPAIYIYIFLAGNAPHLSGRQYIIFFFSRRPLTPSRRPAIYNFFFSHRPRTPSRRQYFFFLSPANIFFSLAGNIYIFWLLCFSHPIAQPPVTFFRRLLHLRRRCRRTRRMLPTNLPLPLSPQVSALALYSLSSSQ
jgi:hypothetical protein